jgi:hypothetical protein
MPTLTGMRRYVGMYVHNYLASHQGMLYIIKFKLYGSVKMIRRTRADSGYYIGPANSIPGSKTGVL